MDRRDFMRLGAGAGAAGIAAAVPLRAPGAVRPPPRNGPQNRPFWVKDPAPFIQHSTNLETRLETLHGIITPNERFFVRNHSPTPLIDAESYRLLVEGDGVERTVELTFRDLQDLPSRSVISYLECAGNWRRFFQTVHGREAQGGQWGTGGVGCAEWTGCSLAAVLDLAGLRPEAAYVHLEGLDRTGFGRPLGRAKALDPDTLLAYGMNGVELPPDHGFPLRGVVPGWVASSSVKWLGAIYVSRDPVWVNTNTASYVLIGPEWPAEQYAPAQGGPIDRQNIKSTLALPWPARLPRGVQTLRGFAYAPDARIMRVEWSEDGGSEWHPARLLEPLLPHAWARFEFSWSGSPGTHELRVRATDESGTTQPSNVPFNEKGYLLNVPLAHPVEVA